MIFFISSYQALIRESKTSMSKIEIKEKKAKEIFFSCLKFLLKLVSFRQGERH